MKLSRYPRVLDNAGSACWPAGPQHEENRGTASTTHRVDSGAIVLFVCATSTTHLVSHQSVLSFRPSFSPSTTSDPEPRALLLSTQTLSDPELALLTTSVHSFCHAQKSLDPASIALRNCCWRIQLARVEPQDPGFLLEIRTRRNSQRP
jgi:hypothetical protein